MPKYQLDRVNSEFIILKDDIEIPLDTPVKINLTFIEKFKKHTISFSDLKSFYTTLKNIKDLKKSSIIIEDNSLKFEVDTKIVLEQGTIKKDLYKIEYSKEQFLKTVGFADYSYTNYFMPKWSTAYKFPYSNHCKMVEPLFTDLKNNLLFIKKLLSSEETYSEDKSKIDFILNNKKISPTNISNLELQGITSVDRDLTSEEILHFSPKYNNCIYIKRLQNIITQIKIKGLQNNSFVEEIITLKDDGLVKLKHNFQLIYQLELVDFINLPEDLDTASLSYRVSNVINIEESNLTFSSRKDGSYFEIEGNFLVYKRLENPDNIRVFDLGFDASTCHIYIDLLDNITVLKGGEIYKGRVDAKLDLQIDRDITYNNTKYIETTYLTSSEYLVEVLILDYIKDTHKNKVSISVKSPTSEYYLNTSSKLQTSSEELFINLSDLKKDKISFELNLDHNLEYLVITINDIDGHYKKSNMIIHPKIELKVSENLKPGNLLLIKDERTFILDNLNLQIKETENEY